MKLIDVLNSIGIDPMNTPANAELTVSEGYAAIEQFVRDKDGNPIFTASGDDYVTEVVEFCLPA